MVLHNTDMTVITMTCICQEHVFKKVDSVGGDMCLICMTAPKYTILLDIKENIHDTVIKAFESVISFNIIFMTSPKVQFSVVEIKENIHVSVITGLMKANVKTSHM